MRQAKTYSPLSSALPVAVNARWAERLLLSIFLVASDLAMVALGFWLAFLVRFEVGISWFYQHAVSPFELYSNLVFFLVPLWIVVFRLFGLYDFRNLFSGMREYTLVFNACTLGVLLVILLTFLEPDFVIARAWVIASWVLVTLCVSLGRFAFRRVVRLLRTNGRFLTTVLIVGANEEGQAIAQQLRENTGAGMHVVGFADESASATAEVLPGLSVLGPLDSLATVVRQHGVQEIIVASTALPRKKLLELFENYGDDDNITIRMSSGLYEMLTTGVEVHDIGNVPLLSINKVRLTGVEVVLKRVLDLVVSAAVLLLTWPLMVVSAVAIKLDSPGPVFHRRSVVGVGGKPFQALKFRTMYVDAEERLANNPELQREYQKDFKLRDDPRVTRVGRFLRRSSLDELPQIFNVFLGQMSWVGPRMITAEESARYGKWRLNLSTVKPGITGLWQVSGRSDVSYEERVKLDMHYVRNYSIWLDIYLLWRTIPVVLKGHGAY